MRLAVSRVCPRRRFVSSRKTAAEHWREKRGSHKKTRFKGHEAAILQVVAANPGEITSYTAARGNLATGSGDAL